MPGRSSWARSQVSTIGPVGDAGAAEELDVEVDALTDDRAIADELGKLGGDGREERRVLEEAASMPVRRSIW